MRVLIACEYSGRMREAFRRRGHDAWSCDLIPSEDDSPHHITGNVLDVIGDGWDMMIAHPPCTYLCNSGVRWLHEKEGRWQEMEAAAAFFLELLNAPIDRVAVENPVMHGYAREIIGRRADFTVQPWMFGDNFKKRTCFWTRGLTPLKATSSLDGSSAVAECHRMPPGPNRWKERSRTYAGMAKAAAEQWG